MHCVGKPVCRGCTGPREGTVCGQVVSARGKCGKLTADGWLATSPKMGTRPSGGACPGEICEHPATHLLSASPDLHTLLHSALCPFPGARAVLRTRLWFMELSEGRGWWWWWFRGIGPRVGGCLALLPPGPRRASCCLLWSTHQKIILGTLQEGFGFVLNNYIYSLILFLF